MPTIMPNLSVQLGVLRRLAHHGAVALYILLLGLIRVGLHQPKLHLLRSDVYSCFAVTVCTMLHTIHLPRSCFAATLYILLLPLQA